jgi:hypothetical protein
MSHKKPKPKQQFNYALYRRMARGIHDAFCEDSAWCNYGLPEAEDLHHCQAAVDAENIAAHISFGKGAKVRKFRPADKDDDEPSE